jgi:MIP family channel proteins
MIYPYWKRLTAELIGTFGFLLFAFSGIAVAVIQSDVMGAVGVAAAFGLGLGMMIFAFGHISGGHFNPAVTLGLAVGRQFPPKEIAGYWFAQVVGAFAACGLAGTLWGDQVRAALVNAPSVSQGAALVGEIVFVALFVIVISAVATDTAPWSGVMAPLAIGGFIFVAGIAVWPFTGGGFNPARALAPAVYDMAWGNLWLYIVGPLAGGALGGIVYWFMRERDPGDMGALEEMASVE